MASRGAACRRTGRWPGAGLAAYALLTLLGGCSPIETYRSFVGIDLNDPDPKTSPFTQNLAAGETEGYPNLATVPPPPTRATTTAERQKLTETLVTNRTDAEAAPTTPVPANVTVASATPPGVAPCPSPVTASPNPPAAPKPQPTQAHHRKQGEPPEPQPQESSLQMPEVSAAPEPETPCATLPVPNLPPLPAVAVAPEALPPGAVASAMPAPAPPVPVIADLPSPPPASAVKPQAKRPAPGTLVATLALPGTPPRVEGDARAQIDHVAALYKAAPRNVRVVAYAQPGAPGAAGGEPLAGYHAALERAQAVAAALQAAGIPADKVQSEAAPASGADAADRVEIQLMP